MSSFAEQQVRLQLIHALETDTPSPDEIRMRNIFLALLRGTADPERHPIEAEALDCMIATGIARFNLTNPNFREE